MSKLKLPTTTRIGIWQAYGKKCVFCDELIRFPELEIDHIIPESLNERPEKLKQIKSELDLPLDFNINSLSNLVPAHRGCNSAKSGKIFRPSAARFFLEIAAEKEAKINRHIKAVALADSKELLLARIRAAFESGSMTLSDLSELASEGASFRLNRSIKFEGEDLGGQIRRKEIDALLDKPVLIGGDNAIEGVKFVNDTGSEMLVRTCRQYRAARAAGYYAPTTLGMKAEAFLSAADAVLSAVERARPASVSYISNPFAGVSDLHLLTKDVLPQFGSDNTTAVAEMTETSLKDLSRKRELLVIDVSSTRLQFEWNGQGAVLMELLRADLDGDGLEEILIQYYLYAVGGTLGLGFIGVLKRPEPDAMFEYESYSH